MSTMIQKAECVKLSNYLLPSLADARRQAARVRCVVLRCRYMRELDARHAAGPAHAPTALYAAARDAWHAAEDEYGAALDESEREEGNAAALAPAPVDDGCTLDYGHRDYPDRLAEAWESGWGCGAAMIAADAPSGYDSEERHAWLTGYSQGFQFAADEVNAEHAAFVDDMAREARHADFPLAYGAWTGYEG